MGREIRYMNESAGVPGAPIGSIANPVSKSVGGFASDVYTLTIDTNTPAADYVFEPEGVSGNLNSITAVGGADAPATALACAVAAAGNADVAGAWSISASAAVVTFQAKAIGRTVAISESDAKMTLAQTSSAANGVGLGYGLAAELLSDDTVAVADGSGVLLGITVRQNAGYTSAFDRGVTANIPAGEVATLATNGRLMVQLDAGISSVAASDTVYYRVGGTGTLGAFTNTADGANTVELVGAKFFSDAKRIHNQPTYAAALLFNVA